MIGFIWNPSNCECECDKCDIGEYLDNSNYKCRRKLVDPIAEECTENIEKTKLVKTLTENKNKDKCSSCTLYIILFSVSFTINIGIGIYFVYS